MNCFISCCLALLAVLFFETRKDTLYNLSWNYSGYLVTENDISDNRP